MIYLILTASLTNKLASMIQEDRMTRYKYAIEQSLQFVNDTNDIKPIIVENNGHRGTPLDHIVWKDTIVPVIYTENNDTVYRNKGVNELLDLQEIIRQLDIKDTDIVIKLTGRYRLLSSHFIDHVRKTQTEYDVWMKFFNVCSLTYDDNDCILGMYAMRVQYIQWLSWTMLNMYDSPEQAMTRYVRQSIPRICPMEQLDMECLFSDDGRVLNV